MSGGNFDDSTMQSDLQAYAALYKKVSPKALLGGTSKTTLGAETRQMIHQLACAPALSQIVITATGGPPNQAAQQAAKAAQAEYAKCQGQLGGLMSHAQNLTSHLSVGMNITDYTQAVGDVRAAYDEVPFHQMDLKCLGWAGTLRTR